MSSAQAHLGFTAKMELSKSVCGKKEKYVVIRDAEIKIFVTSG
jgi:hypothetical protein